MADFLPPTNQGVFCTTTSYYNVRITKEMNMNPMNSPQTAVYSPTKTMNQGKPSSLYDVTNIKVGKYVTCIESNEHGSHK